MKNGYKIKKKSKEANDTTSPSLLLISFIRYSATNATLNA